MTSDVRLRVGVRVGVRVCLCLRLRLRLGRAFPFSLLLESPSQLILFSKSSSLSEIYGRGA
jgi:hypothetical protein